MTAPAQGLLRRLPWSLATRLGLGLGTRGMEVAGKLVLYVLIARQLSLADAGLYFTGLAWSLLIGALARGGLERALTARVPAELAVGDGPAAVRVIRRSLLFILAGCIVVGGLNAWAGPLVAIRLMDQPSLAPVLALTSLLTTLEVFAVTPAGILAGLGRNVAAQLVGNALWPVLTLAVLWLGQLRTVEEAIYATMAARAVTAALGFLLILGQRQRFAVRPAGPLAPMPPIRHLAIPLMGVELAQYALMSLPTLVLAAVMPPEVVGAFSMAVRISLLPWALLLNVSLIAAPRMSEHHRREEWPRLRAVHRTARWTAAALTVPPLAAMFVLAPWLLGLLGAGLEQAAMDLRILCLGQAVNALFAMRDTLLSSTGHGQALFRINLAQVVLGAVLTATLVPLYGSEGAAAMTAITTGFGGLASSWMARRCLPRAF